jgi:hypothetical protein
MLPPIKWTPSPNYSSRGGQKVRLICTHDCEGSYAGSVAWFAMSKSQVSAHLVLREDGGEATQMVAWGDKAWHACNFNPFSEGIEAAGFASKGLGSPELDSLAALVAWRLLKNDIPCQEATAANMWTGYTTHAKLGAAGGGHHDWTENGAVWADFVGRVATAYADGLPNAPVPNPSPVPVPPPNYKPNVSPRIDDADAMTKAAADLKDAVEAFQKIARLDVDGDPGPSTRDAYLKAIAA